MVDAETVKTWTESAGNVAQVFAFASGGLWALQRYRREREKWPRAGVEHSLEHRRLDDATLLRVTLRIENTGRVLLELVDARTDVYRVLPLDDDARRLLARGALLDGESHEAQWTCVDSHERRWPAGAVEIEPGESDELGFDFLVPSDVTVVSVYSYVSNATKRRRTARGVKGLVEWARRSIRPDESDGNEPFIGWGKTTTYDIGSPAGELRSGAANLSAKGTS